MQNYQSYAVIARKHEGDVKFTAWLEELKGVFGRAYPSSPLELDEHFLIQSYNSGMTPMYACMKIATPDL